MLDPITLTDDEADLVIDALQGACAIGAMHAIDAQEVVDKIMAAGWQNGDTDV